MTTILVTKEHVAHIATVSHDPVSSKTAQVKGVIQLPLASRFPARSTPRTAVAPSGHIFLWAESTNIVWEYNSRGRRVGEISSKCKSIKRVFGLGKVEGKETAIIDGGADLRVWTKSSTGTWEMGIQINGGRHLIDIAIIQPSNQIAIIEDQRIRLCNMEGAEGSAVTLVSELGNEAVARAAVVSASPLKLFVASARRVVQVTIEQNGESTIAPLPNVSDKSPIIAIAKQPAVSSTADSYQVALCRADGGVCILQTDQTDPRPLGFDAADVTDIGFLNNQTLWGRTQDGRVLLLGLSSPSAPPAELKMDHPVLSLCAVPVPVKSAKITTAPPTTSTVRSISQQRKMVLSEARNGGNISSMSGSQNASAKSSAGDTKSSRVLSAPTKQPKAPVPSVKRSASQPTATRQPRPSSSATGRPREDAIVEEEDDVVESHAFQTEPSVYLDWALRSPNRQEGQNAERVDEMAEMRKEIARVQLDMLRLSRTMKSEIRKAVQPLRDEVEENRATIERQVEEIERLRRAR